MTDSYHPNLEREKQLVDFRDYVLRCAAPEPEDLYQEVCLAALRLTLDWSRSQRALLKRITRFGAALQWRQAYRRRRRETYLTADPEDPKATTTDDGLERLRQAAMLNRAMARLREAERSIIQRVDLGGVSLRQVATEAGRPYRTIQSEHTRARDRLSRLCDIVAREDR
jgi:RNA polymerase sigma factor (sigma-70 family)